MKANLNSKVWDFVPVVAFLLVAAIEGRNFWMAALCGFFGIGWLALTIFRIAINSKPKKM